MSRLEVGTEVWADIAEPHNIALDESEGRPGVVVYVQPDEEPDEEDRHPQYGWNSDDVIVRWRNGVERSYQYKHITPFNPDDELDWEYDAEVDPLYGDKPWIPEPRTSPYLDELRVRRNRIHDGLFAVSQVDIATPEVMRGLAEIRDYVDAQIEHEKEKFNG